MEDSRVVAALEEYLAALEAGASPDRGDFLARHPQIAEALADRLEGLELLCAAASQVRAPGAELPRSAPSADAALHPEAPLGDFRIVREIGRGGMGVVYEAVQLSLGRRVALKVLPFAAALDTKQLARFKNEAQAAAHLHHTNIVPVFGVGCERGVHYYAMQFIDGQTVAALIREMRRLAGAREKGPVSSLPSPLPVQGRREGETDRPTALATERSATTRGYFRLAAQLGIQAAEALEHAHQMGVVHRDGKPANLLIDGRGNLWVTDFGLAQLQGDVGLTQTGDLVGTLRYMSPEQANGKHAVVDQRSDVYALGATLYELLTLQPAFAAADRYELLTQIAFREPRRPRQLNKAIPAELETIVLKALEKGPAERYATAQELADDLRRFLDDRPIQAKRPTLVQWARKWSRRHKALVAAASVVMFVTTLAALLSALLVWRAKDRAEQARQRADAAYEAEKAALGKEAEQRRRAEEVIWAALDALDEDYLQEPERQSRAHPPREQANRGRLEKALRLYEQLVRYNSPNPAIRQVIGNSLRRVGDIHLALKRHAKAEEAYGRAIALLEELVRNFPAVPRYRYELAGSYHNLGALLVNAGRPREAERPLHRALALSEELHQELSGAPLQGLMEALRCSRPPGKMDHASRQGPPLQEKLVGKLMNYLRSELGHNHVHLGLMFAATGRPEQADSAYRRALALQEKLVADEPESPVWRQALALTLGNRARLLRATGRPREAEQSYGQARALLKKLATDFPAEPSHRHGLAISWCDLGLLLVDTDRLPEAEQAIRQAMQLQQKLVDDFPFWPPYRSDLARCRNDHGNVLRGCGRPREAEKAYRQAIALLGKLAEDFPNEPEYRRYQARSLSNLGHLLEAGGRAREAEAPLRQAQALYEKLPGAPADLRNELAGNHHTLARVLSATGRAPEARQAYQRAAGLWERLAADFPREASHQSNLGGALAGLAHLLNAQKEWAKARPLAERAIRHQQAALRLGPRGPFYRRLLRDHYLVLARAQLGLGDHGEAARTAEDGARIVPPSWEGAFHGAEVLAHCVPLAEKDDNLAPAQRQEKARAYIGRIQALLRKVARLGGDEPEAKNALALFLCLTGPRQVADPDRAVQLAKQAVARSHRNGTYWSTLGIALCRAGKPDKAVFALEQSVALRSGGAPLDWFFLAMAHARLGAKDKAGRWYDKAAGWMEKNRVDSKDFQRIRAEAAALLGSE
jgi:serine/threonine protein kinase/Flp pilus assembly protein TadD